MNTGERAQSYASAFHEAAFERWLNALAGVATTLAGDRTLVDRLQAAGVELAQRQEILDSAIPADTDSLVRNLLLTLMQHGDLGLLPDITAALRQRRAEAAPIAVEVVTAAALDDDQRQALEARLVAQHGAGLIFSYRIDPAILGGIIVRIGDKLIDGSVASRLAAMKQALGVTSATQSE